PRCTLFPYTTLFRSAEPVAVRLGRRVARQVLERAQQPRVRVEPGRRLLVLRPAPALERLQPHGDVLERVVRVLELVLHLVENARSEEHTSELQSREN